MVGPIESTAYTCTGLWNDQRFSTCYVTTCTCMYMYAGSQCLSSPLFPMQVRKAAQEAVTLLLKKPPGDMQHHPASATTAKFCVQQIEEHGGKRVGLNDPQRPRCGCSGQEGVKWAKAVQTKVYKNEPLFL